MDLRTEILRELSSAQRDRIVHWIGNKQERFDALVKLFLEDEYRVVQRAAWPLSVAAEKHPGLVSKHLSKLVKNLHKPNTHDAVRRNTVRLLQDINIPKKLHGEVMDICFGFITDPREKAAVKAFSLTVLENLHQQYPEIGQELKTIIEDRWQNESAAFRSRARHLLKKL